jgi:hypothetical protein
MSNPKMWSAATVAMVAPVIALGIGQVISDDAIPAANAAPTGNNGWGNGADPTNPGSDNGIGVSQGNNGNGVSVGGAQDVTKTGEICRPSKKCSPPLR